jgi:uncharacterized protein YgbK (DUF1537 family)
VSLAHRLPVAFYGDDFTGSTDVMEALTANGVPTVLFLAPPDEAALQRFADCRAVGVAGISRTQSPAWMSEHLPGIFARLRELQPALLHYKTCSTFDSSPEVGSIGRAIEIGREACGTRTVPLVVGAPVLKRYVVFGNLFATADGVTYRIDRHPTMSRHPVTPMDEGDLRVHLGRQTRLAVGLVDLLSDASARYRELREAGLPVALFDTLTPDDARRVGEALWVHREEPVQFVAGSSGLEYALAAYWKSLGWLAEPPPPADPGPVDRLFVFSGSCSPGTERQIRWAMANGFTGVLVDAAALLTGGVEEDRVRREAVRLLAEGKSVVVYSALGPGDAGGLAASDRLRLAERSGSLAARIVQESGVTRVVIAGGDTSGFVSREMGIEALRMLRPMYPGSPLCTAYLAGGTREILLKGGQVGGADLFGAVRRGSL